MLHQQGAIEMLWLHFRLCCLNLSRVFYAEVTFQALARTRKQLADLAASMRQLVTDCAVLRLTYGHDDGRNQLGRNPIT